MCVYFMGDTKYSSKLIDIQGNSILPDTVALGNTIQ